jgi:hypothetical protein
MVPIPAAIMMALDDLIPKANLLGPLFGGY